MGHYALTADMCGNKWLAVVNNPAWRRYQYVSSMAAWLRYTAKRGTQAGTSTPSCHFRSLETANVCRSEWRLARLSSRAASRCH
jgi:hypothetical protein